MAWMTLAREGDFESLEGSGVQELPRPRADERDLHSNHGTSEQRAREEENDQGALKIESGQVSLSALEELASGSERTHRQSSNVGDDKAIPGTKRISTEDNERRVERQGRESGCEDQESCSAKGMVGQNDENRTPRGNVFGSRERTHDRLP